MATLAAVVVTALMMWFLDRFSPYSARNNREKYGPNARIFTLKESFWYAITQITPEGKFLYCCLVIFYLSNKSPFFKKSPVNHDKFVIQQLFIIRARCISMKKKFEEGLFHIK